MNTLALRRSTLPFVLLALAAAGHAQVTLIGEDFSGGLATGVANASDYALTPTGVFTAPPVYRVISNPNAAFTNNYTQFFDHTTGTGSGAMEFFDGANSSATRIFYRTFTATAGVTYSLSFWGASCNTLNTPVLNMTVDGAGVGGSLGVVNGQWQKLSATYTAASSGTKTFAIVDSILINDGNDGAIDDVLVTAPVPEPAPCVALGLGAFALLRRRR